MLDFRRGLDRRHVLEGGPALEFMRRLALRHGLEYDPALWFGRGLEFRYGVGFGHRLGLMGRLVFRPVKRQRVRCQASLVSVHL